MKDDVSVAIENGIHERRKILSGLAQQDRKSLLEQLFIDLFGHQHITLQKWAALTGQSAQVDTGYIAQFVASIVLGEPGQGFRGKGDDLADGGEVKGAANISGVDRPRWNHNLGTVSEDAARRRKGQLTKSEEYLEAPYLFYLLVDRVVGASKPAPIRVRAWCVDAQEDEDWRGLIKDWLNTRDAKRYNFQLHPPVGWNDDIVVNSLDNLDFAEILVFDARIDLIDPTDPKVDWHVELKNPVRPVLGRTRRLIYGGPSSRPSRLTAAEDLVADIAVLPALFPGILYASQEAAIEEVSAQEAVASESG